MNDKKLLEEAASLLERVRHAWYLHNWSELSALLDRATAPPAAPTPLDALFGAIPDLPLEPAAPTPPAELDWAAMYEKCEAELTATQEASFTHAAARESAEAQLAAAVKSLGEVGRELELEREEHVLTHSALRAERAAHAETRKALEYANQCIQGWEKKCRDLDCTAERRADEAVDALESTRAELANAEARILELEMQDE